MDKIETEDTSVWIFQANPNVYDLINALSDSNLNIQRWQVNQNRDKIKKGDIALMWMSGKEGGIYAVGEIISNPAFLPDYPESDKYWINDNKKAANLLRVDINIKIKLIYNPIFRSYLRNIKELENLSILKYSQATNFPVTKEEWKVIKQIVVSHDT